jgi:hypothetical protein
MRKNARIPRATAPIEAPTPTPIATACLLAYEVPVMAEAALVGLVVLDVIVFPREGVGKTVEVVMVQIVGAGNSVVTRVVRTFQSLVSVGTAGLDVVNVVVDGVGTTKDNVVIGRSSPGTTVRF